MIEKISQERKESLSKLSTIRITKGNRNKQNILEAKRC